jgi:hypothetical protein
MGLLREETARDATSEQEKVAFYGVLKLHNSFKIQSKTQQNMKPPSIANVKNYVPVSQKHILKGKERLDGLRNLRTRYEKKLWKPTSTT